MKRAVLLFLLLVTILGLTVSCQKEEIDNNYINEKYGFTFEIPKTWEEKVKIIEEDDMISFIYKSESESSQEFFTIGIVSKEEYERILNDPPITSELLAEKDDLVYVLNMPLDNILPLEEIESYREIQLSVEEIKERFLLSE